MNPHKYRFIQWIIASTMLFLIIPGLNMLDGGLRTPLKKDMLFNTDVIEGYINLCLYKAGISGDIDNVVVGQDGWMFLGNKYNRVIDKMRGGKFESSSPDEITRTVRTLARKQRWLESKGIMTIYGIAPNKHSIYREFLPHWLKLPESNSTDEFVHVAANAGINLVDMRNIFLEEKEDNSLLYFKTDTHWNGYGAFIAYKKILIALNTKYHANLHIIDNVSSTTLHRAAGDLSAFLKIKELLSADYDSGINTSFIGNDDIVCIKDLKRKSSSRECIPEKNRGTTELPQLVINDHALNNVSVLWLRDSFGYYNSQLMHKTFKKVWEVHYRNLPKEKYYSFINKYRPDMVIYQVVERNILGTTLQ